MWNQLEHLSAYISYIWPRLVCVLVSLLILSVFWVFLETKGQIYFWWNGKPTSLICSKLTIKVCIVLLTKRRSGKISRGVMLQHVCVWPPFVLKENRRMFPFTLLYVQTSYNYIIQNILWIIWVNCGVIMANVLRQYITNNVSCISTEKAGIFPYLALNGICMNLFNQNAKNEPNAAQVLLA